MSRVNLEDELFGERRLFSLAQKMGWDRRTALGALAMVWHESQALLVIDGSAEELAEWAWCLDDAEAARFISALLSAKYISALDNGRYLIHGNETQIENRIKKLGASVKGGNATKAKWAASHAERQAIRPRKARPDAGPAARPDGLPNARPDGVAEPGLMLGPDQTSPDQTSPDQVFLSADGGREDASLTTKSSRKPKPRTTTWDQSDPFAGVFAHLIAWPKYAAIFDVAKDRAAIEGHMAHNRLTVADLEQVAYELRHWADGPNAEKIKSPRGTLLTFVKTYVERRIASPPMPSAAKKPIPTLTEDDYANQP